MMVIACLEESITQVNLPIIVSGKSVQAKGSKIKQKLYLFFSSGLFSHRYSKITRK